MKTNHFDTLNCEAKLFLILKQSNPSWWKNMINDRELYIDIRKDNYINVYYYGGAFAKIEYKNKEAVATIHEKYLGDDGIFQKGSENNRDPYKKLDLENLTPDRMAEIKSNIRKHYIDKGNPEKISETKMKGKLILTNPQYIDSEFQYDKDPKFKGLRIDLTELCDGKLSFIEIKGVTDKRLLNDETRNKNLPEIINQMYKYQSFIGKYKNEIKEYYLKLLQLKTELGLFYRNIDFEVNLIPKLLIIDTYQYPISKRKAKRIDAIEKLLEQNNITYEILNYYGL